MDNNEFLFWNSSKIIEAYTKKDLSPVEVIKASLEQSQEIQKECNAFTEFFYVNSIKLAKIAEENYLNKSENLKLLEGVPFGVKEEFALRGSSRTSASKIFKNRKDNHTDVYINRILIGGAIPIFKTTTPEFCLLGTTWSDLHGVTTNPWNNKYTPRGWSGGSGTALATGACAIASGSDIVGSIRVPAAACGVFG